MTRKPLQVLVALASGVLFGLGLAISGMIDPARVQGFLDVFGAWDPSLAFVLGGAVTVAFGGMFWVRNMRRPVLDDTFHMPTNTWIDGRLILGSAIFGIGWGLGGFCPGPAIASLSLGLTQTFLFVAFMVAGMVLHDRFVAGRSS